VLIYNAYHEMTEPDAIPDFLAFTSPGHQGGFWLLVASKPQP
jgi:hypothetical protein